MSVMPTSAFVYQILWLVRNNLLRLLATQARIFYTLVLQFSQRLVNDFLKEV